MSQHMTNGVVGVDTRPRFLIAICRECSQRVEYIEPRHMEAATVRSWQEGHHKAGRMTRSRMTRSLWREGACVCPE